MGGRGEGWRWGRGEWGMRVGIGEGSEVAPTWVWERWRGRAERMG